MYTKSVLIFMVAILSFSSAAQNRFSVDDTLRFVSGGTSWGVLHHFIQANNKVGDTLSMRWRKKVTGNPPSAWVVNFADPESNHIDISMIDSIDFIFPDSLSNHTYNKFVIGVDPKGALGSASYQFTIFEKQFPADSIRITYNVEVYTGMNLLERTQEITAYPNPVKDCIHIPSLSASAKVSLYHLNGTQLPSPTRSDNHPSLDMSVFPSGIYLIQIEEKGELQHIKISIEH